MSVRRTGHQEGSRKKAEGKVNSFSCPASLTALLGLCPGSACNMQICREVCLLLSDDDANPDLPPSFQGKMLQAMSQMQA